MTVGEVLDVAVALDGGRYGWLETRGALLVRPILAWNDKAHYLHEVRGSFAVHDKSADEAARLIERFLEPDALYGPLSPGRRDTRLTFTVPGASVLDALNAVVTAYDPGFWSIRYGWPPCTSWLHRRVPLAEPPCSAVNRDVWLDVSVTWRDRSQTTGTGWFRRVPNQVMRPETPMHFPFWPLR